MPAVAFRACGVRPEFNGIHKPTPPAQLNLLHQPAAHGTTAATALLTLPARRWRAVTLGPHHVTVAFQIPWIPRPVVFCRDM